MDSDGVLADLEHVDGGTEEIVLVADAPATHGTIAVRPREPIALEQGDIIRPRPFMFDLGPDLGEHLVTFPRHVVGQRVAAGDLYGFVIDLSHQP